MNIVTITSQKRIVMGTLTTAQFTVIFVGNGSRALCTRASTLHMQQVCVG